MTDFSEDMFGDVEEKKSPLSAKKPKKRTSKRRVEQIAYKVARLAQRHVTQDSYLKDSRKVYRILSNAFDHLPQTQVAANAGISRGTLDKWLKEYRDWRDDETGTVKCSEPLKVFGEWYYRFHGSLWNLSSRLVRKSIRKGDTKVAAKIFTTINKEEFGAPQGKGKVVDKSQHLQITFNGEQAQEVLQSRDPQRIVQFLNNIAAKINMRLVPIGTPLIEDKGRVGDEPPI